MAILFGHKSAKMPAANTQVLNGVRVNSSTYGNVVTIGIGKNRFVQCLIGLFDFLRTTHTTPGAHIGKGVGAGGSTPATTSYTYSTAYQALLGFGEIDHIDAVWTSAGKVPVTQLSQDFTIPGGGGHIDISDGGFIGDKGVGFHAAYSQVFDDFGGTSGTLSGTYQTPGSPGSVASAGVYVISSPSAGVTRYTFAAADAGKTVTIYYSTNFATVRLTAEIVIPSGGAYTVPDTTNYRGDSRVNYASTGDQLFGPGDHAVAGHYSADNSGDFQFATADEGETVVITYDSADPNSDPSSSIMNWSLIKGTPAQTAWSYLTGRHADAALAHPNVALVQSADLELGSTAAMPQLSFEGFTPQYAAGAGNDDCNPADVIEAILTDPVWGVGIDPALLGDWSNARTFWQAHGFFISLLQDTQRTAWDVIDAILDAGQAVRFWNDGQLQIAVYGDTSFAGNGAIYLPDTQPVVEFDTSDFVSGEAAEPVKVETEPENHVFNRVKVEYLNTINDYNTDVIMEDDPASVQKYGLNEEAQQDWSFIRAANVAQMAANLRLKRMTTVRDKFTMTVTTRYRPLIAPMKLITITFAPMGWDNKPLRILSIEDDHSGLALTLEEFPYGVSKPTLYPKMTPQAQNANPALINPGDADIVALEIPDLMNGFAGRIVRFYASPQTPSNWGGCILFTSDDDAEFIPRGRITAPVVFGELSGSGMTTGTGDPDTQSITVVVASGLQIPQPSSTDFDNLLSLLAIISGSDVEIVAYKNATLTGENEYTLDHFHRGLFGTTRASHSASDGVIELGQDFIEYSYPASRDGSDLFFKAASFNKMSLRLQDLGDLTSGSIVLTGDFPGFYDKADGTLSLGKTIDDSASGRLARSAAHSAYRPTSNPLTAHDAGSHATINIAGFDMRIPNTNAGYTDIPISSGSITTLSYDTLYFVYYDDLTLAGGSVTFLESTTKEDAIASGASWFVGSIRTPKAGAVDTIGYNDGGATAHTGSITRLFFTNVNPSTAISGHYISPSNTIDTDATTIGSIKSVAGGALSGAAIITISALPPVTRAWSHATINCIAALPTNSVDGGSGFNVASLGWLDDKGNGGTFILKIESSFSTVAVQMFTDTLPTNVNLNALRVVGSVTAQWGDVTTGTVQLDIYEAWVEFYE